MYYLKTKFKEKTTLKLFPEIIEADITDKNIQNIRENRIQTRCQITKTTSKLSHSFTVSGVKLRNNINFHLKANKLEKGNKTK